VPKKLQRLEQTSSRKPNNFLIDLEPKTTETKLNAQNTKNDYHKILLPLKSTCDIQRYRRRQKYN
jgi:hypothetical protein